MFILKYLFEYIDLYIVSKIKKFIKISYFYLS